MQLWIWQSLQIEDLRGAQVGAVTAAAKLGRLGPRADWAREGRVAPAEHKPDIKFKNPTNPCTPSLH